MRPPLLLASFVTLGSLQLANASDLPTLGEVLTDGAEIVSILNVGSGEVFRVDLLNDRTSEFYSCYLHHDVRRAVQERKQSGSKQEATVNRIPNQSEGSGQLVFDQNGMLIVPGERTKNDKGDSALGAVETAAHIEKSNSCIKAS